MTNSILTDSLPAVNPQPSTNGHHSGHNAPNIDELLAMADAAHVTLEPEAGHEAEEALQENQPPALDELLGELGNCLVEAEDGFNWEETSKRARRWALDNQESIVSISPADANRLYEQLIEEFAVKKSWIHGTLRPAVNKMRKAAGADATPGGDIDGYISTIEKGGWMLRFNVLEDKVEINGSPIDALVNSSIYAHCNRRGLKNESTMEHALNLVAGDNLFHPVRDYLESLEWDGQDHIAALSRYFTDKHDPIAYADGTSRTVFHSFFRLWCIGAAAKPYNIAQNPMLVLAGAQDAGKSWFVNWLCKPLSSVFFEGEIKPDDKDYLRYLSTRWVWEVSELGSTVRRKDRESLKAFITQQRAIYRPAHGKRVLDKPALANFIGTVNLDGDLLNDPTGARRFHIVELNGIDWGYAKAVDQNQVWAQAYALWRGGETWRLSTEEKAVHQTIVEMHQADDPYEDYVREHFEIDTTKADDKDWFVKTTDIVDKLYHATRDSRGRIQQRIPATMRRLGVQKHRKPGRNGERGYVGLRERPGEPIIKGFG